MKKIIMLFSMVLVLYINASLILQENKDVNAENNYYLEMDGVNDYLKTPSIAFDTIVIDCYINNDSNQPQVAYFLLDARNGVTEGQVAYAYPGIGNNIDSLYINESKIPKDYYWTTNGAWSRYIPKDVRQVIKVQYDREYIDDINFYSNVGNNWSLKGRIYSIKIYSASNLVAYYDMSKGNVLDQSGNGHDAILGGGTWRDASTGVDQNTISVGIKPGGVNVSYQETTPVTFGTITTDGTVKTVSTTLDSVLVQDHMGTGNGWTLTLEATPFTEVVTSGGSPMGLTLPNSSLSYKGIFSTSQTISTKLITDSIIDNGSPVTIAIAGIGEGNGDTIIQHQNPSIELEVDTSKKYVNINNIDESGVTPYESIFTWSVTAGP